MLNQQWEDEWGQIPLSVALFSWSWSVLLLLLFALLLLLMTLGSISCVLVTQLGLFLLPSSLPSQGCTPTLLCYHVHWGHGECQTALLSLSFPTHSRMPTFRCLNVQISQVFMC